MYAHKEADRVPIMDSPWGTTTERWLREGMAKDVSWTDFFGLDSVAAIDLDISPRWEWTTLEETDEYTISRTNWGATLKNWKHIASTPDFLDFTIKTPEAWREAKARMTPTRDRVNWDNLKKNYAAWRKKGCWVQANFNFGFDLTHSWVCGTERILMALAENPEWCVDMFTTQVEMSIALAELVLAEGYPFDSIFWCDDLGYKGHTFMSVDMYRELVKPAHKRAIEWAHSKGIKAHMHSCGDIRTLIPEFIDNGLDALNPLEVKAGVDTLEVKRKYGKDLVLHGGMNAVLWSNIDAMEAEIRAKLPALKQGGGYIWATDHSIPDVVSLKDFQRVVALVKSLGAY
jgi:uroporphyrinogen decarboxylase